MPVLMAAYVVASAAFTLFFGGTLRDALCGGLCGLAIGASLLFMARLGTNLFFKTIAGGFVCALLAVALTGGLTFYFDPQLEWVTLSPLGAAAAGLLCFCPTISNVGEALQWRRLKRKN